MDARTRLVEKSCRMSELRRPTMARVVRVFPADKPRRSLNMAGHKVPNLFR